MFQFEGALFKQAAQHCEGKVYKSCSIAKTKPHPPADPTSRIRVKNVDFVWSRGTILCVVRALAALANVGVSFEKFLAALDNSDSRAFAERPTIFREW